MEDYVLYEELGRRKNCIIYKGRMKGTINFVAIYCLAKCLRHEVTNMVRVMHDINHENVAKFYEWYETANHMWIILEICTGGSLATVITQDIRLPESSIQIFGKDMVAGLSHLHSLNIIFCDLNPNKILLDGSGALKFTDFSLSKINGEDLRKVFEKTAGADYPEKKNVTSIFKDWTKGSLEYMAPELFLGSDNTICSDLWSLGCVLYEMFVGTPPFQAESEYELIDKILNEDHQLLLLQNLSGKISPDFFHLVDGLLKKNPRDRLFWPEVVRHSFWNGILDDLIISVDRLFVKLNRRKIQFSSGLEK